MNVVLVCAAAKISLKEKVENNRLLYCVIFYCNSLVHVRKGYKRKENAL